MEYLTPMTAHEVIERVGTKRAEWDDLLRQVPAEQMSQPLMDAWTVRDAVAIVTWKERQLIQTIRHRAYVEVSFGELPEAEQSRILDAGRALSLPALLEQHRATHREVLAALRTLTDDDVNSDQMDGLPPDVRFWKAIGTATWWIYSAFSAHLREVLEG